MNAKGKPMHVCRRDVVIAALGCWRIVVLRPIANFFIMRLRLMQNDTIILLATRIVELLLRDCAREVR